MQTSYDKTDYYNEAIASLIEEVEKRCKSAEIPFFFTAAVAEQNNKTEYRSVGLTPLPMGKHLSNDQIAQHINVTLGLETVLPEMLPEMDYSV